MDKHNDIEFDLVELLLFIKKKLLIVLLVVALFASAGFAYNKLMKTPTYTADARLYLMHTSSSEVDINTMQIVTALRKDVAVLITGRDIGEAVVEKLQTNLNPDSLAGRIKVASEDSTRVLDVSFTDTNPQRAADILNAACDAVKEKMDTRMGGNVVDIVYRAKVPSVPSSARASSSAILFGIVGLVVVLLVLIVMFLMDDTIRSEDDVERHLGLSTLSSIPICEELSSMKQIGNKRSAHGGAHHKAR